MLDKTILVDDAVMIQSIDSDQESANDDMELINEAKKRFEICQDDSAEIRKEASKDLEFLSGNQWDEATKKNRVANNRPYQTINKLHPYVNQVVNDARQNRPAIKIRPVDSVSDPATSEVLQGLIRNIQNNGDYKSSIDSALYGAVSCGIGYIRVSTDYANDGSFDNQEILVDRVEDPLSVYFPINSIRKADYSDAKYAFVRYSMPKDEYKEQYPNQCDDDFFNSDDSDWVSDDIVWLAEYFKVEEEESESYLLSDGQIISSEDMPEVLPELLTVIKSRKVIKKYVMQYLMNGSYILDRKRLDSKFIPIIPVLGQELIVKGVKNYISLIRFARDPQVSYNYAKTTELETLALAPRAPWVAEEFQLAGYEKDWQQSNIKNTTVLKYKATSFANGTPIPPPQRQDPPQVNMSAIRAMNEASDDIKAVTGIFDASLGAKGNESSGRAIVARQRQGDTSNYHFMENLNKALRQLGNIFVDLIPSIYDVPRVIRILGEDSVDEVVQVNQLHNDPKRGNDKLYDLTVGKYDVVIDIGPSYETKRIETAETMVKLMGVAPQIGQYCSDIIVRSLDISGAQELADRLKKLLPPGLVEGQNPDKISDEEVRAIIADMQTLQQQLQLNQQEKQAMMQTIAQYQSLLKDKSDQQQLAMNQTVIKASTDIQKANLALEQEKVKQHGNYVNNAVDAAVELNNSNSRDATITRAFE